MIITLAVRTVHAGTGDERRVSTNALGEGGKWFRRSSLSCLFYEVEDVSRILSYPVCFQSWKDFSAKTLPLHAYRDSISDFLDEHPISSLLREGSFFHIWLLTYISS